MELGTFLILFGVVLIVILLVAAVHGAIFHFGWGSSLGPGHWPDLYGLERVATLAGLLVLVGFVFLLIGLLSSDFLGWDDDTWKILGIIILLSSLGIWLVIGAINDPYWTFAKVGAGLAALGLLALALLFFGWILPEDDNKEPEVVFIEATAPPSPRPSIIIQTAGPTPTPQIITPGPSPTPRVVVETAPPPVIIQATPLFIEVPVEVLGPIIVIEPEMVEPGPVVQPIVAPIVIDQAPEDEGYQGPR